jgi:hypothetical protein
LLGNEVVSEVTKTGKKQKTFVFAGGTKIATQALYGVNNNNELLVFKHADASGASLKETAADGTPAGLEDGFAELDAMGGNVGLATPYIELNPFPFPQSENPPLMGITDDSPTYINGQRVTATLDGFPISLSRAMHMMDVGTAIPASLAQYQNRPGFSFTSNGLGLFTANVPSLLGYGLKTGDEGYMVAGAGDSKGIQDIFNVARNHDYTVHRVWLVNDVSFSFGIALSGAASQTIQTTGTKTKFDTFEIDSLFGDLVSVMTDSCKNFLSQMAKNINNLSPNGNVNRDNKDNYKFFYGLFDEIASQTGENAGFFFDDNMTATATASDNKDGLRIRFRTQTYSMTYLRAEINSAYRANVLIHEMIHIAIKNVGIGHQQMYDLSLQSAKTLDGNFQPPKKVLAKEDFVNSDIAKGYTDYDHYISEQAGLIFQKFCTYRKNKGVKKR